MKVGDLVKFQSVLSGDVDAFEDRNKHDVGLVLAMSKTGHDTESAHVLFNDGDTWWVGTQRLEVVNDGH